MKRLLGTIAVTGLLSVGLASPAMASTSAGEPSGEPVDWQSSGETVAAQGDFDAADAIVEDVTDVSSTDSSLCTSVASAPTGTAMQLAGDANGDEVEPQIPIAECTRIYNIRTQACGIIPTPRIRAICYAEAMEEYARCLSGASSEPSRVET